MLNNRDSNADMPIMKIVVFIAVVVLLVAGIGGYMFLYSDSPDENGDNGEEDENGNGGDNGGGGGGGSGITASFVYTYNDTDHNGAISVKEEVRFDATGSTGGDFFEWDFGDGRRDISGNPQVIYHFTDAGTFDVTVNVSSGEKWDTFTRTLTVVAVSHPSVALHARNPQNFTENRTGVSWVITVTSASGGGDQMNLYNLYVALNRTGNETPYFIAYLSELPAAPPTTQADWEEGIYYRDRDASGSLSSFDEFSISGDGGLDVPVEAGDVFSIYFVPTNELLDTVELPTAE